jgi:formylmethanofuran dehydrogenase subunit E
MSTAPDLERIETCDEADHLDDLPVNRKPPLNLNRAGTVRCLRCGKTFESWNRTRNRLCNPCNNRQPW